MAAGREKLPPHPWRYIAAFIALAALALLVVAAILSAIEKQRRQDQYQQLSTLAQLKAERLESWLTERRLDIEALAANPAWQADIRRFAAHPDAAIGIRLQGQFQASRVMEDAISVELFSGQGQPLLTVGRKVRNEEPLPPKPFTAMAPQTAFIDLHRDAPGGPVHLAYELAVHDTRAPDGPLAAYLRVTLDPERTLYPLVRSWPLPSTSGETLLVRQEEDQLLVLNELRYLDHSAFNLRLPLAMAGTPASPDGDLAYSGQDYRQVPVLGAVRKVGGTPWLLIAKADETELFGGLRDLRSLAVGVTLLSLGLGGLLLRQIWHRQALQGRHALARQLVDLADTVPGALVSFRVEADGSASFPYASPAMEELCGLTAACLAEDADPFLAMVHPDDREHVRITLADSAGRLKLWHAEFRILHPQRGEVWIEGRSAPRREEDGSILWHGFIQDISERRASEHALQRATERWRQLAEAMPQLVWIGAKSGECQYLNRHWVDYTGCAAAGQAGHAWLEAVHPDDRPRLAAALAQPAPDNGIVDGEFRLRGADGRYRWFKTHAVPMRDRAEEPMVWYGFNTDIQEIKEFETALHRSLLRQQALQQLDRAVLEARTPEEVAAKGLAHLDSLLSCWGSAALAIDLEAGEGTVLALKGDGAPGYAVGQRHPLSIFGAQDLALLENGQIRVIADVAAQANRTPLVERLYQQGMRSYVRIPLMVERRLLGAVTLGSDQAGHFGKAEVEIARSIADVLAIALQQARLRQIQAQQTATLETRVQERTAQLERLKNQAEAASLAKSQFLANISQELQIPLHSLLILSEMLADNARGNLTPEQQGFARVIHSAGSDLLGLINDILDISKIESGRAAVQGSDFGFEAVLGYVDHLFRKPAESRGLHLDLQLADELPDFLHTDFDHLKPILRNLMANAIKFTPAGLVGLRIYPASGGWSPGRPSLARAAMVVAFEVSDTGIGIPAEKLAIIFDAFPQAEAGVSRRYGGIGLGLHIARTNADLLGGDLTVASTPGQGSTFTLYLPQALAAPASMAKAGGRSLPGTWAA